MGSYDPDDIIIRHIPPIFNAQQPSIYHAMPEARHTQSVSAGTQHAPTNEDSPGGWMSDGTAPVGLELALELLPVVP